MNIEWLKNKAKEKFFPITHAKAVLFGENNRTVNDEIDELKNDLFNPINIVQRFINTSANTLQYTGVSVTIPAKCAFSFSARSNWNNAKPVKCAVSSSSTTISVDDVCSISADGCGSTTYSGYNSSSSDVTYYIWGSWESANANDVYVKGFYLHIG